MNKNQKDIMIYLLVLVLAFTVMISEFGSANVMGTLETRIEQLETQQEPCSVLSPR